MVNTRQKGKELEKYIAEQIIEKGLDSKAYARGDSGGGNKEKTDVSTSMMILGQNAGIEAKNQKVAKVSEWWKQTRKLQSLGYEPVLVYSLQYEPFSDAKVVIYLDTLLELIKATRGENEPLEVATKLNYNQRSALNGLKTYITKVLKEFDHE